MEKENIRTFLTYLQSQQTAQNYLLQCYRKQRVEQAERKSYENSSSLLYYLQHGWKFFQTGECADPFIQPVLYFYGLTHFMKAIVLTMRPNYPETSSILSHGLSTRKRKKKQYTFLEDEVKTQQKGLFPYACEHVYGFKKQTNTKWKMEDLFTGIPEMQVLFQYGKKEQAMITIGQKETTVLHFPMDILDHYFLTAEAFIMRIQPFLPTIANMNTDNHVLTIELTVPINHLQGPFKIHVNNGDIYFPYYRDVYFTYPETIAHYLLLYNLSMICRYETEWWGDLLATKPEMDYPFIIHFLQITAEKIPLMIGQQLLEKLSENAY